MPVLFAVVGLSVLTGTASYTNRLQVLLASMAQNESDDILSLINTCTPRQVGLLGLLLFILNWHSTDAQFVFFCFYVYLLVWVFHGYYYILGYGARQVVVVPCYSQESLKTFIGRLPSTMKPLSDQF